MQTNDEKKRGLWAVRVPGTYRREQERPGKLKHIEWGRGRDASETDMRRCIIRLDRRCSRDALMNRNETHEQTVDLLRAAKRMAEPANNVHN